MSKPFDFDKFNLSEVVANDKNRLAFISEVTRAKEKFQAMGMTELGEILGDIEIVAEFVGAEELSSLINSFQAKAEAATAKPQAAPMEPEAPIGGGVGGEIGGAAPKPLIMAVDDRPELLTTLVNMLKKDYTVMAATNATIALKMLDKQKPDLFLLDIEMPGIDGYRLARMIRSREGFERTPIIFLTGKNTRDDVVSAVEHGGNDYMIKPVEKFILYEKICKFLS